MTARPDSLLGLWRELLTALGVHRPETSPDDLLADIAEVLRADETRVRVIELPLRLARFRADRYAGWAPHQIAYGLRVRGVPLQNVGDYLVLQRADLADGIRRSGNEKPS
jgi:hypothetical protein